MSSNFGFNISKLKFPQNSRKPITDLTKLSIDDGGRKKNRYKNGDVYPTLRHKAWSGVKCRLYST